MLYLWHRVCVNHTSSHRWLSVVSASESTSTQLKTRAASTRGNTTQRQPTMQMRKQSALGSRGEMLTLTTRDRENTRPERNRKPAAQIIRGHLDMVNNLAMHVTFWSCFKSTDKSQRDVKHLWRRDGKNRWYIRRGSYRNVEFEFEKHTKR